MFNDSAPLFQFPCPTAKDAGQMIHCTDPFLLNPISGNKETGRGGPLLRSSAFAVIAVEQICAWPAATRMRTNGP